MNRPVEVNLTELIDKNPVSAFQFRIFILCALVAFLDGVDTQSIGVAAPFIADTLKLPKGQLGLVFSGALIGAMIGALVLGACADRLGRKRVLIASALLFGAGTIATASAHTLGSLIAWRVAAGIGLGGATPCFISLASEYAPARRRSSIISLLWAAFPLGGMLGGFFNSYLLRFYDWHAIFLLGGALPILLAVALAFWLPESARFLAGRDGKSATLKRIMQKLTGTQAPAHVTVDDHGPSGASIGHLFSEKRARGTLLLSGAFFMSFGTLAVIVLWTPALLHAGGVSPADTAVVIGFHGLGALAGMGIVGRMIERFGPAITLVPSLLVGTVATAALGYVSTSVAGASVVMTAIGVFLGIGASGSIALAVMAYPATLRSTGVGWSMSMGRLGQVIAPIATGAVFQAGFSPPQTLLAVAALPLVAALLVVSMSVGHLLPRGPVHEAKQSTFAGR
jgi:AAHS family 4-hydroxybenzoate transporter-like MFS transporter